MSKSESGETMVRGEQSGLAGEGGLQLASITV